MTSRGHSGTRCVAQVQKPYWNELVDKDRLLMRMSADVRPDEEFRLQTKESADWFAYQRGEEDRAAQ
jgi:hypothetical protein